VEMKFLGKAFQNKLISVSYSAFWCENKFVNFIGVFQAASGKGKLFVPSNIQGMILIKFFPWVFYCWCDLGFP
jgi:hypothetical protein